MSPLPHHLEGRSETAVLDGEALFQEDDLTRLLEPIQLVHVGERQDIVVDGCAKLFSFKGVWNTELLFIAKSDEVIWIDNE